ncbi:hypothetical protein Q4534_23775 [Cyclobacterium sp. 1_MG-2023]|uniref:hypothetical protein n=1 Tax=Cyclobacterium sp. 1_MG-2023 TaxID=3062681 RepID=UPI0026E2BF76|nr:hypothetical protein [Cyclobacterium sp. 1_MG-2023]MDO6440465.1 hypothetical protein [Cyclobacterium sp. 1_MG-2023]
MACGGFEALSCPPKPKLATERKPCWQPFTCHKLYAVCVPSMGIWYRRYQIIPEGENLCRSMSVACAEFYRYPSCEGVPGNLIRLGVDQDHAYAWKD